jgi:hypothetical protein
MSIVCEVWILRTLKGCILDISPAGVAYRHAQKLDKNFSIECSCTSIIVLVPEEFQLINELRPRKSAIRTTLFS